MAFLSEFITTVINMILIAAVAFCGIRLGKVLRDRKDAKTAAEEAAASSKEPI
jgi:large-conductance mechanosensitive channel